MAVSSANQKWISKRYLLMPEFAFGGHLDGTHVAQPPVVSNPHRSGVSGLFEDLSGRLNVLAVLAALQQTHLLLHPHAQAL